MKDTGKRLRLIRTDLGLNQTLFAESLGKKQRDISHYEHGRLPGQPVLQKLHEMGYSIDWLVTGQGEMYLSKSGEISRSGKTDLALPGIDSLTFFESAREGILIVQDGIRIYVNSSLERITGFSAEELVGRPLGDIIIPEQRKQFLAEYKGAASGINAPVCDAFSIEKKDGTIKEIVASYVNIQYQGKAAILGIVHDVSGKRRLAVENILKDHTGVVTSLSDDELKLVRILKQLLEDFLERNQ